VGLKWVRVVGLFEKKRPINAGKGGVFVVFDVGLYLLVSHFVAIDEAGLPRLLHLEVVINEFFPPPVLLLHVEEHRVDVFLVVFPEELGLCSGFDYFVLVLVEAGVELVHVQVFHFVGVEQRGVVLDLDGLHEVAGAE
jgi:hypothetical protein